MEDNSFGKIIMSYKYENSEDLVGDITYFFDRYILYKSKYNLFTTYLWNDLITCEDNTYNISFRVPGSTRGHLKLKYVGNKQFKIQDIYFIYDTCFGEYGCYNKELEKDCLMFIDSVLDFSKVDLRNSEKLFGGQ